MKIQNDCLVLPQTGCEIVEKEEMSYESSGKFYGITLSAAVCSTFYNFGNAKAMQVVTIGAAVKMLAGFCPAFASALSALSSALAAIPIWGLIALGVLALSLGALFLAGRSAGSHNKGFRFGLESSGLKAKFVCGEY